MSAAIARRLAWIACFVVLVFGVFGADWHRLILTALVGLTFAVLSLAPTGDAK